MGDDVLLRLRLAVAVQEVAQPVHQRAEERAVDHPLHRGAVAHEEAQHAGGIAAGPVAGGVGFGKTDVAAFQRSGEHVPVGQVHVGHRTAVAEAGALAVGELHQQGTVLGTRQQLQDPAHLGRERALVERVGAVADGIGGQAQGDIVHGRWTQAESVATDGLDARSGVAGGVREGAGAADCERVSDTAGGAGLRKNGTRLSHSRNACQ